MSLLLNAYVGIDVSKLSLDVCVLFGKEETDVKTFSKKEAQFENTEVGINAFIDWLSDTEPVRIVVESTGGYERPVFKKCRECKLPIFIVNPARTRNCAKMYGLLAKTDRIDALVIARFAHIAEPDLRDAPSARVERLRSLTVRRSQLIKFRTSEKNRLDHSTHDLTDDFIIATIRDSIAFIDAQLERIDDLICSEIAKDPDLVEKQNRLQTIPGVGEKTSACILASMPELGLLNRGQIACLAGLAPLNRDSGQFRGKRKISGGRREVRNALYIVALTGLRFNPVIKEFNDRLKKNGKKWRVRVTACMRKLLIIMNTMLKNKEDFRGEIC